MGNHIPAVEAIRVHANSDSLVSPGEKSVVSDPIGKDVCADFDVFFEDVLNSIKQPFSVIELLLVKDLETTEHSKDEVEIKVILNGKLLQLAKFQEHGEDQIVRWVRLSIDREKHQITGMQFELDGTNKGQSTTVFLHNTVDDTFQLESWLVDPNGERRFGRVWAGIVQEIYLRPMLSIRHRHKVITLPHAESRKGTGKVVSVTLLEEFFSSGEELLDLLVAGLKTETLDQKGTVEYVGTDDSELLLTSKVATGDAQVPEIVVTRKLVVNREEKTLVTDHTLNGHHLLQMAFEVIDDPMTLEVYTKRLTGFRSGGHNEAVVVRGILDKLITEREVGEEVTGLDEQNFYF